MTPGTITIATDSARTHFLPGEQVAGTIHWSFASPPPAIDVELRWETRGKGTVDHEVVDSVRLDDPPAAGNREFRLRLPLAPYSFSGRLVSLIWAVRASAERSKVEHRLPITVSPTGQEIDVTKPQAK